MSSKLQKEINASSVLGTLLSKIAFMITKITNAVEKVPGKYLEIIACVIYAIAHIFVCIVHEPWYDEAVSWNIAKSASLADILFTVPHYEGHPQLWHLILVPFAKIGAPYEASLLIISLFFAGLACSLIIWKSPFPRIVRILLPFTYFFFYQYGVITRPYCVMMLVFVFLAMTYNGRNEKPWRYVLGLALLCLTSAYGILFAGGLSIAWLIEIWNRQNVWTFISHMFKDKRIVCLIALLIFALLLIATISPREDTFATTQPAMYEQNNVIICLCYTLFVLPIETAITSLLADANGTLLQTSFWYPVFVAIAMLGVVFWAFVISIGRNKKTLLPLLIPYVLFATFAAFVYMTRHHVGVCLLFFVFWAWITCNSKTNLKTVEKQTKNRKMFADLALIVGTVAMCISLFWTVSACVNEVQYSYAIGRYEAEFIKQHKLDEMRIMVAWQVDDTDKDNPLIDINHCYNADNVAPYFDNNLFFNFNDGRNDMNYTTHRRASDEYTKERFEQWGNELPEVCFGKPDLELIFDEIDFDKEYTLVYAQKHYIIWKSDKCLTQSRIYVRNDLLEALGLSKVQV